jgi:phosphoribosylformylglycinamidine synthase subunit PurL
MTSKELRFDFSKMKSTEIQEILSQHQIILTVEEALKIQNEILKRPPTLSECILWSIQGSEHCSYKSTRQHLGQFITDAPNVMLGPTEDAGVVTVTQDEQGKRYGIIMSHESHNHPSQIVPYEGAATGIGGNIRDVCCMGGQVIAVADSLRFGDIELNKTQWLHEGIVAGIAGYGNPVGVPNIAGDVYFDSGYNDNCLVTVVTLGSLAEDELIHSYTPDLSENYQLILVGKATDNSGFGGASFASINLEQDKPNKGAVQEPNAFLGRHLLKAHYALFEKLKEKNLLDKVGFKDLGAGGIACASVELADGNDFGAEIHLENVHTSMDDIASSVILCSETQERYMWSVPEELVELILDHYNKVFDLPGVSDGSRASVVGHIRSDEKYQVFHNGELIVDANAKDITQGIRYDRPVKSKAKAPVEPTVDMPEDFNDVLLGLLSHENIASREMIYENYDKQVQGQTYIEAGQADAGVIQPFMDDKYPQEIRLTGIALSVDQNPRYNKVDAYWGAKNAVAESIRNVACVGASPQALTDCLCFGNPENPEQMGEFTEAVCGIVDACKEYHLKEHPNHAIPIIGGNVSLYNESKDGAIPPSPIISCLGKMSDVKKAITSGFKVEGTCILMVGERRDECGGSVYYDLHGQLGAQIPKPDLRELERQVCALTDAIDKGLILAAHDISDGGIAVAIAEMCFPKKMGVAVEIPSGLEQDKILFSESGGFVLEVERDNLDEVEDIFAHYHCASFHIGMTTNTKRLQMQDCIDLSIVFAEQAWREGLRQKLL